MISVDYDNVERESARFGAIFSALIWGRVNWFGAFDVSA